MAEIGVCQQPANTIAPVAFGLVQRGVGSLQQLVECLPLLRPMGQAGRQGHTLVAATGGDIASRQLRADALQALAGLARIGARQYQQKLFAADTKHRIGAAQVVQQVLRDGLEHVVADQVAAFVVEALEVIKIDQGQRQWQVLALCPGQLALEELIQITTVVQPGQRITQGLFAQLFMQAGDGAQALLAQRQCFSQLEFTEVALRKVISSAAVTIQQRLARCSRMKLSRPGKSRWRVTQCASRIPPQTHQQRHHYRCRETPARSHAGLHQRRRRIPGEAALESRTHATQDDWTMTRIEIHKGLPDLQCWSGAGCLDTAKALPQLGFIGPYLSDVRRAAQHTGGHRGQQHNAH